MAILQNCMEIITPCSTVRIFLDEVVGGGSKNDCAIGMVVESVFPLVNLNGVCVIEKSL